MLWKHFPQSKCLKVSGCWRIPSFILFWNVQLNYIASDDISCTCSLLIIFSKYFGDKTKNPSLKTLCSLEPFILHTICLLNHFQKKPGYSETTVLKSAYNLFWKQIYNRSLLLSSNVINSNMALYSKLFEIIIWLNDTGKWICCCFIEGETNLKPHKVITTDIFSACW